MVDDVVPGAERKRAQGGRRFELPLQRVASAVAYQKARADVRLGPSIAQALYTNDEVVQAVGHDEVVESVGAAGGVGGGAHPSSHFLRPARLDKEVGVVLKISSHDEWPVEIVDQLRSGLEELPIAYTRQGLASPEIR